jgi:exopolyphosphatase/guanosine-5'-triphosphate,3'-diphosphate pyrophosphatase
MDTIASVEIGTNSIRMLIAERGNANGTLRPVLRKRSITRLGEDFGKTKDGVLKREAMDRSISVLEDFFHLASRYNVSSLRAVATGVVRKASNRSRFIRLIERELGHTVRIISGQEEAYLTWRGVISSLNQRRQRLVVFDLGGGSTEFIWSHNNERRTISIDLGVITATEKYLYSDPPKNDEIGQLINHIVETIQRNLGSWKEIERDTFILIGTGGTAVSLAAMTHGIEVSDFDGKVHGLIVTRKKIGLLFKKMRDVPARERLTLKGLEPGREGTILAGTLIVMNIMEYFKKDEIKVSYSDLLEGILVDFLEGEKNGLSEDE